MKIRENVGRSFDNSAVRKQYSAENFFRPTIFLRFDKTANLFIGQMLRLRVCVCVYSIFNFLNHCTNGLRYQLKFGTLLKSLQS